MASDAGRMSIYGGVGDVRVKVWFFLQFPQFFDPLWIAWMD